jgi:agmatinase
MISKNKNKNINLNINSFMNLPKEYCSKKKSKVVIVPINYESYKSNVNSYKTINSYKKIISASNELEYFDIDLEIEPYEQGVFLEKEISSKYKNHNKAIIDITNKIKKLTLNEKFPVFIGGDHSLTQSTVGFFEDLKEDFGVIVFDAHSDLREDFNDKESWPHACVTRKISLNHKTVVLGVRSQSLEEYEFLKSNNVFSKNISIIKSKEILDHKNYNYLERILEKLPSKVFISFDVDVFDTSIIKCTGTPEPGGLDWYKINDLLKIIFKNKEVLGVDIVEFAPNRNNCFSESFILSKLIYKIIAYKFYINNYTK